MILWTWTINATVIYKNSELLTFLFDFSAKSPEYQAAMKKILEVTEEHEKNMKRGKAEFDWCDLAVQVRKPEFTNIDPSQIAFHIIDGYTVSYWHRLQT